MSQKPTIYQYGETNWVQRTFNVTVNGLAPGARIEICDLPQGFRVGFAELDYHGMGTGSALGLGDLVEDSARLVYVADAETAGISGMTPSAGSVAVGRGYQYDQRTTIYLTNIGASATTESNLIVKVTLGGSGRSGGANHLDI